MVAGRRRWLETMRWAKTQGLIDKIPSGRRRPTVGAASTKAIARARGIAYNELEAGTKSASVKRPEERTLPEQWDDLTRKSFEFLSALLDHPAGDSVELLRLQATAAKQLLSLCK
jgi:hypothetical protein